MYKMPTQKTMSKLLEELKYEFFHWCGTLSIDEIGSNPALIKNIELLERAIIKARTENAEESQKEHDAKKIIIPIETHLATIQRVLSKMEKWSNPLLMHRMAKLRLKVMELKALLDWITKAKQPSQDQFKDEDKGTSKAGALAQVEIEKLEGVLL